jgi:hypothetical protein
MFHTTVQAVAPKVITQYFPPLLLQVVEQVADILVKHRVEELILLYLVVQVAVLLTLLESENMELEQAAKVITEVKITLMVHLTQAQAVEGLEQ